MSSAATTNPSSICWGSTTPPPFGSHTTPEGERPYITTERSRPSAALTRAIHGPGQAKLVGSATETRAIPWDPSQPRTFQSSLMSPFKLGSGSSSSATSRIVARQARNEATSVDSPGLEILVSLMGWRLCSPCDRAPAHLLGVGVRAADRLLAGGGGRRLGPRVRDHGL